MTKFNLNILDFLIVVAYFAIILIIGIWGRKSTRNEKDSDATNNFILAGRKVTLPFFVASLVATWYGNILGIGEFVYRKGLVAWFCFGIVYYASAFIYAVFVATKVRGSLFQSIPEQIGARFGKYSQTISSVVILLITFPAVYVLMVGVLFQMFTGLNFIVSVVLGTVISAVYLSIGGFRSNIVTNSVQFILMYVGFGILLIYSLASVNFDISIVNNLPSSHKQFFGEESWQYIFSWFLISLQTFVDPSFYQRCATAKSPKTARNGILVSIIFWILFDSLTIVSGLIAKVKFPNIEPILAYPVLSDNVLPHILKGIFIVSMLATIISTMDSYSFLSGLIIGKEFLAKSRLFRRISAVNHVRIGIVISCAFSISIAIAIPSAIDIIYKTSSIVVPALLIPLVASYTNRAIFTPTQVNLLMMLSSVATLFFSILKEYAKHFSTNFFSFILGFEPMVFGVIFSLFLSLMFLLTPKK
jgi:SSS family solute:Na+ symporter